MCVIMCYYAFAIVSLIWLTYFLLHDYFSYISLLGSIHYSFYVSPWRRAHARNVRPYFPFIGSLPTFDKNIQFYLVYLYFGEQQSNTVTERISEISMDLVIELNYQLAYKMAANAKVIAQYITLTLVRILYIFVHTINERWGMTSV